MKAIILFISIFFSHISYAQECVVLLHGYLRNSKCMEPIAEILNAKGYKVQNISYPSTSHSIQAISREHIAPKIDHANCEKIHFVGHSMGGIVTRHYLSENKLSNLGNVILITTPNNGSELVSSLANNSTFAWTLIGPAVRELSEGSELLRNIPEPYYKTGVITASRSINPVTSIFLLDGLDDGTLTIESMKLPNMTDIINLDSNHTRVLVHPDIGDRIESFLKYNRFVR